MESSGCTYNAMASNYSTEFCHEVEANTVGESTFSHKTKTNKKTDRLDATGITDAANFSFYCASNGNQFNFPFDQTKAN